MNLLSSLLKYTADQIAALRAKDTSQDTTVSGINSRLITAEGDIDSLEAQFTTVVSAVTTDTEVTNIRVGDDGVTYDTAGNAVRKQFSDVKSDINDTASVVTDETSQDVVVLDGYSIYPAGDGTYRITNLGSGYRTTYFKMQEGYLYTVKISSGNAKRFAYSNSYPGQTNIADDSSTFKGSYTFTKHPSYSWFFVSNNADTVTITRQKIKEATATGLLQNDITNRFVFENNKVLIANSENQYFGQTIDEQGYKTSTFTSVVGITKIKINFASIIRTASAKNIGLVFYDKTNTAISGVVQIDEYANRNNVMEIDVPTNAIYVRVAVRTSENFTPFYCYGYSNQISVQSKGFDYWSERIIRIAASNARAQEKELADYVCTGTNDELVIQNAINVNRFAYNLKIVLSTGDFYFDSFTDYNGKKIAIEWSFLDWSVKFYKSICGTKRSGEEATVIHVTQTALDALGNNIGYVFSTKTYVYGRGVDYSEMQIRLADNQHKVTIIDNSVFISGICKDLTLSASDPINNSRTIPMPVENCVGITGYAGDDSATHNQMERIVCLGFYEAFRLGGEHLVGINLSARFNYIGFTFGNYDWYEGTQSHPITLINCDDEYSAKLPIFVRSGNYNEQSQKTKQQIDLIGFNMELERIENFGGGNVEPCEEMVDGAFCGRIEFTGYGASNVGRSESPYTTNMKAIKFWADGHGHGFRTVNMAHSLAGTTAERETYEPTYMQQYFDTTLNKMLVYNGSAWVDMNGNLLT